MGCLLDLIYGEAGCVHLSVLILNSIHMYA